MISLRPSLFLMRCIFFVFELSQGRQCLFEVRSMPEYHCIGTNFVRTNLPSNSEFSNFFLSQVMHVVFVRQVVHLATNLLSSTGVIHDLAELFVSYESVVDTQVVLPFALLLERICRCSTLCHLASSRNGARGVALSLCIS